MRLTKITVTNFQGLRHAALGLSEPLLLVSGANGAGKSSLLDAISMAFTGEPRRVSKKKDLGQLVTDGAKKGEAHITYLDSNGEEQAAWIMLPTGKTAPLVDAPLLPFVLDAARFAGLDGKERRQVLFELTGASASPNEIAKRLTDRGADAALVKKIKPMLRAGFPAAADQAKEHAAEARGAWKAITGEAYGSQKAESWAPERPPVDVSQADLDAASTELVDLEADLEEAQQTLGAHKANRDAEAGRAARIAELQELAALVTRRQHKLSNDSADLQHWKDQLAAAEAAATGGKQGLIHDMARNLSDWQALAERSTSVEEENSLVSQWHTVDTLDCTRLLLDRYVQEHGSLAEAGAQADQSLARRAPEFRTYVDNLTRAVENDRRDLAAAEQAAGQLAELQAQAASVPSAEAIANAEQVITDLRQQRDRLRAKVESLCDALTTAQQFEQLKASAAGHHRDVIEWSLIADALAPDGIPAEILTGALEPVNNLLAIQSAAANWAPVQINPDIDIAYGGRAYGLLSESEKWRCDALLAIAIARLSGLRFVTLDRFDVLQPSARPQILGLLRTLTQGGDLDTAILAGTMKEPMAKVPMGIQSVWIAEGSIVASISQQQAA